MGRAEDLFESVVGGGEAAIDEMIARRQVEELFLDFKRSSDFGAGTRLSNTDRENLARAISGFGNSEGGVLIWGVDCSADDTGFDAARAKVPVELPDRFLSWLEGAVSGCTIPPHIGVRHVAIPSGTAATGFVATLIPRSERVPHQVVGRQHYLMRAGSSFVPVPHGILAGMFGREPTPTLLQHWLANQLIVQDEAIRFELGLILANAGPGIARDVFINVRCHGPGVPSAVGCRFSEETTWNAVTVFGDLHSLISKESIRMPPESIVHAMVINFRLQPPFQSELAIHGLAGATGAAPHRFELSASREHLDEVFSEFVQTLGAHDKQVAMRFVSRLFAIDAV